MTILGQMLEARGIEKGINALIRDNLEDGKTKEQILGKLERRFSISMEDAKQYFDRCVNAIAKEND